MKAFCCTFLCMFLLSAISSAQQIPLKEIERNLQQEFERMESFIGSEGRDSLLIEHRIIIDKLKYYSDRNTAMITDKNITIHMLISDDSLLKIYSWDQFGGGSINYMVNVPQYKSQGKLYIKDNYTSNEFYDDVDDYDSICTLKGDKGTIYLVFSSYGMGSHAFPGYGQRVSLYTITGDTLNQYTQLIKAADGMTSTIHVEFYEYLNMGDKYSIPGNLIHYNPRKKNIYVANIDPEGHFREGYLEYHFNGKCFERVFPTK